MAIKFQDNTKLSYDEWLLARLNSIGASEVAVIVFGSKYSSSLELFYQKIGAPKASVENIRMYLGKETEDISANSLWRYYNGTDQSIVENARKNNPVKKCIDLKTTTFNDAYPHLSVTIDREIQPFGKYEGRGKGALEIKNTQGFVLSSYGGGLPPENVTQLCTQIMVSEYQYGELFYFIDNRTCQCHPIERKDTGNIEEVILKHTIPFWNNVLEGRKIYNAAFEAKRTGNQRLYDSCMRDLAALEPPPQNSAGYLNFLTDKYKDRLSGAGVIQGKEDQLLIAKNHKELAKQIDALQIQQRKYEIELKNIIGNMSMIDFGKQGKVAWMENKNGQRSFKNSVK